ncbi:MAG: polyamine aminopropyltransferase [Deltaproteobacteria bacterium]|nr:polyamine aminopropyltransferase [Deltaproteobacteria bacterium]
MGVFLKISLFATGCAGIVAEYVLSTLATYLLGNAILQWTVIISLMLFAMGVGSRLSRYFRTDLLDCFILIEFILSALCAACVTLAYGLAAFTEYTALLIYAQAIVIGILIGLEIPLVLRLNQSYEALRINVSEVMEKDYYGALLGGFAFAFIALPTLGLAYTPIVLGVTNFSVAALLLWGYFPLVRRKGLLGGGFGLTCLVLIGLAVIAKPVIRYGEQRKYRDKVIHASQTPYQKLVMTQWKQYYWLYINGQEQFSTYDEDKYHEPLVHPAMKASINPENVLILGGGDGLALREVLTHPKVRAVTLVDIDPAMTQLAQTHPVLVSVNRDAMSDNRVTIVNRDAARFLADDDHLYGVIIADLPDPDTVDLMSVYSESFYQQIRRHLIRGGAMVTQAGSPYFTRKAFLCIYKTVRAAGFSTLAYHNQIPTMGQWGWVLGTAATDHTDATLRARMMTETFEGLPTRFLNQDAMIGMMHFGKGVFEESVLNEIKINTEFNPVLHSYYLSGNWGVY